MKIHFCLIYEIYIFIFYFIVQDLRFIDIDDIDDYIELIE